MQNLYAIIVAGGSGQRFSAEMRQSGIQVPKQFLLLNDKPILMHSLQRFYDSDNAINIILVLPKEQISYWQELCKRYQFNIAHEVVEGGRTRTESVKNGLHQVPADAIVAIHDGVRPLLTTSLITHAFLQAAERGSAIPAIPATDSLRKTTGESVDRDTIVCVQTPQVFRADEIKRAYKILGEQSFSDDATAYEKAGFKPTIIEGEKNNIKITTPIDLLVANEIQKNPKS